MYDSHMFCLKFLRPLQLPNEECPYSRHVHAPVPTNDDDVGDGVVAVAVV